MMKRQPEPEEYEGKLKGRKMKRQSNKKRQRKMSPGRTENVGAGAGVIDVI